MTSIRSVGASLFLSALVLASCSDDSADRLASATTTTGPAITTTTSTIAAPAPTAPTPTASAPTTPAPTGPATGSSTTRVGGPSTTIAAPAATSPVTTSRAAPLFGVPIGAATDGAVTTLAGLLGPPATDSGWGVGCPLDSPTDKNERVITWGRLRVQFRRDTEAAPGAMQGYGVVVPQGAPLAATDPAARLALPSGVTMGMPIADVATKLATTSEVNDTFGYVSVTTPGAVFTADGASGTAPLNAVSVPHPFSCE